MVSEDTGRNVMKNNEHAPKVFLLGDSIIDNGPYVGNMPTVTDEVETVSYTHLTLPTKRIV